MTTRSLLYAATLWVLMWPVDVGAQAPGGPGNTSPGASPSTGGQGGGLGPASPQFGAWLDDASLEGQGTGRVTIGAGYWQTADGRQIDVPMIDAGYDLSDRIHVAAFVPFYRARFSGQLTAGVDDVYLNAKIVLVNAAKAGGRFGLAVSPALEVLNSDVTTGGRMHWALPVSAEVRVTPRIRIYGAGGYFSRGAAFGALATEWTAPTGSVIWLALTDSYALETGTDLEPPTDRHLTNVAVGVKQLMNERLAVYANIGRTIFGTSAGGPIIGVGGGISIRLSRTKAMP
jgi:hypothetical protein